MAAMAEEANSAHGSPIQTLLGSPGDPVACKVFTADVSVHWYPPDAKPGDKCLCGATTMSELADADEG